MNNCGFGTATRDLRGETHELSPGDLAKDALNLVSDRVKRSLTLDVDDRLQGARPVTGSRMPLLLVLANLYTNAVEAVAQSGAADGAGNHDVRIHVTAEEESGADGCRLHLRLSDNGPGSAPEIRKRVFERGYSTKSSSRGLGLHWSANVVSAMGGKLYAGGNENAPGTCFHLVLPCAEERSGDDV